MNDQEKSENYSAGQQSGNAEQNVEKDSREVDIQPSEIETDTEENAPGRTAGKAEGSRETIEEDLAKKEDASV